LIAEELSDLSILMQFEWTLVELDGKLALVAEQHLSSHRI